MSEPTTFSIFKRSNGIWYILFERDGRGCWKSSHSRSKQEALKKIARLKDFLKPLPKRMVLSQFIREFLLYARATYSAKTTTMYAAVLQSFQKSVDDLPLDELTCKHVDSYKAQ